VGWDERILAEDWRRGMSVGDQVGRVVVQGVKVMRTANVVADLLNLVDSH